MLQRAAVKSQRSCNGDAPDWIEADALNLPFPSEHFDLVTSAFGFRNLADYDAGLREILRVLRPGGECGILDFGEPKGVMGTLYRIYFKQVLPRVGTLISGVRGPYAYLPASVERFPAPEEMLERMRKAGFAEATWEPYTFGIAGLYRGKKCSVGTTNSSSCRLQQLAQRPNVVSANVSNHKIPQAILRPVFHVERHGVYRSRRQALGFRLHDPEK